MDVEAVVVRKLTLFLVFAIALIGCKRSNGPPIPRGENGSVSASNWGEYYLTPLGIDGAPNDVLFEWTRQNAPLRRRISEDQLSFNSSEILFDGSGIEIDDDFKLKISNNDGIVWLNLGSKVQSDDLSWALSLHRLRGLSLKSTALSPVHMDALGSMSNLQWLDLSRCELPIAGSGFPTLQNVRTLILSYANVDDDALSAIGTQPQLRSISLSGTAVSDSGLENLVRSNPKIRFLDLYACDGITNASIDTFISLKQLEYLGVGRTRLLRESRTTEDSWIELIRSVLPDCYVSTVN